MAQIGYQFNAHDVDPAAPFEVLPPGDYVVQIVQSETKENSAGTGSYLTLEMEILDGERAGQRLFDRLNLWNPNQKAVEIANRTLSAICHATGVMVVEDSEQLHFHPMVAKVVVKPPRTDEKTGKQYDASNEVKGYKPVGAAGAAPTQRGPANPPPQQGGYQQQPPQQQYAPPAGQQGGYQQAPQQGYQQQPAQQGYQAPPAAGGPPKNAPWKRG
ncbi:DUF669 domain-containing protein [Azospirillum sp. TSO5]|uniref:DUF669 domain-containing protein n=1 Tax=Azospirillum sp. TSO5 TaxID=716760 RepID=UPI000D658F8A|nr:DUF669 domain-containing protein [Azospirillum sp. TSO5]